MGYLPSEALPRPPTNPVNSLDEALELGEEEALRGLLGFVLEGRPEPGDVDPRSIQLLGFRLTDPANPDEVAKHGAELEEAARALGPPRIFRSARTVQ